MVFIAVSVIASSLFPIASAQSYSTNLVLNRPSSVVYDGEKITFSGTLTTSSGSGVSGATIDIKDDDPGFDDLIAKTTTDSAGRFSVSVTVKNWDEFSDASEIYAVFEGSSNYAKSRSSTYDVVVEHPRSSSSGSSTSGSSSSSSSVSSTYYPTTITFDKIPSSIHAGQSITFTGKLTSNGSPLSNALIYIYEDDPGPDQRLGYARTDSNGRFSITWNVSAGLVETDFDVYAVFDGDSSYSRARSPNQILSVLKYGGSITLDPIPARANVGDTVTFSGNLILSQRGSEGAVVYIKDEDTLNPDDLLATAYVESSGRFSASWYVTNVDADREADIYAVFEGNDVLYRLTTCDSGPTFDFGGLCKKTVPLGVYGTATAPPPPPTEKPLTGNEYMKLYYALDFTRTPKVAIIPSPDSYDEVRSHIIPVQEGILMWKSQLEQKYGGDWDVDFEVIAPGTLFFQSKPDVIVNLVDYDKEIDCASEFVGLAEVTGVKPIQTWTCSSYQGVKRSNSDVAATSAHEFIHAVGLGHTFNKKDDLM